MGSLTGCIAQPGVSAEAHRCLLWDARSKAPLALSFLLLTDKPRSDAIQPDAVRLYQGHTQVPAAAC
jgi:hypothetical protein